MGFADQPKEEEEEEHDKIKKKKNSHSSSTNPISSLFSVFCSQFLNLASGLFSNQERDDVDDELDSEIRSHGVFAFADKIGNVYKGTIYLGLRIPDADSGIRRNVDMVLVSKRKMTLFAINDVDGIVELRRDGTWIHTSSKGHRKDYHFNPIMEVNLQLSVLECYLQRRGIVLPKDFLKGRVVFTNPKCRVSSSALQCSDVISYEVWSGLKPDTKVGLSKWIKDHLQGPKKDLRSDTMQKLLFVLNTAPIWDRFKLKNGKHILAEFIEMKGKEEDMMALKTIKRSKVDKLTVLDSTDPSLSGEPQLLVRCVYRDYRSEGSSEHVQREFRLSTKTLVLFQPSNSNKVKKLFLSKIDIILLSA